MRNTFLQKKIFFLRAFVCAILVFFCIQAFPISTSAAETIGIRAGETYYLKNASNGKYIDVYNANTFNGTNVILDAFDIYIGYFSTLLVEAAQNGKKVISTLYLMKPQNEASQQRFYEYLENRLNGKGIIYFPKTIEEFKDIINNRPGFIKAMWCGNAVCEAKIKEIRGCKSRCIPFNEEKVDDKCIVCGKPAKDVVIWGIQY